MSSEPAKMNKIQCSAREQRLSCIPKLIRIPSKQVPAHNIPARGTLFYVNIWFGEEKRSLIPPFPRIYIQKERPILYTYTLQREQTRGSDKARKRDDEKTRAFLFIIMPLISGQLVLRIQRLASRAAAPRGGLVVCCFIWNIHFTCDALYSGRNRD